ncbi:hypothetical protein MH928_17290 [Flavobacterium sp. WW92]|uniref:hypothetical protein n=1 Tax=unclassified Flavobacterium TaxID=196869 RepID=UPI0022245D86|nr:MULTISPECIES: hypothetical protein [unclassified Flavobacterium]WDO13063.1 hypothetical protein MH928_17290 [Flavobacterium sp. WW92]
MKSNSSLTLQEILAFKGAIQPGTSLPISNNKAIKSVTHYWTGFLNQLVNGEIVLSKYQDAIGERSLKGNTIPTGTDFFATEIRVTFDTTAGVQAAGILTASFGKTAAPEIFKNGELIINQGADLLRTSGSDVSNFKAVSGDDYIFRSVVPFNLRPDVIYSIKAALAGAAAVDQAFKVEIRGFEFVDTDRA